MARISEGIRQLDAAGWALVLVVFVGYLAGVLTGLSSGEADAVTIGVTLVMAVVYVLFAAAAEDYFERYHSALAALAYFVLQTGLALVINTLLGPGAWLIALPLAALAVEYLPGWWQRLIVYLTILLGLTLPFWQSGDWQQGLFFALTLTPAIFFVVIFTRLNSSEQKAREEAEALAADLEEANHQLGAYATQVEELARSKERNRLARDIHDNLGHYLTVVTVQLRVVEALLDRDPQKAREALVKAQRLNQEGLQAVRRSVAALRESPLAGRPLTDAIEELLDDLRAGGLTAVMSVNGQPLPLDPAVELALFRAVQEGLTNVRKHAQANRVDLRLEYDGPDRLQLSITDDGRGAAANGEPGYGLLGIRERVEQLGGTMQASAQPGTGFTLTVTVPAQPPLAVTQAG